ncbi:hypothetical protein SKAU_G00196340 [Synaphobranchus kaupii]|uniref:Uncharacterized protein n=1 Tax=Synaphobranchus kaupii TaxID=118154 RepID=A0A9Q1FEZ1_SYNKA|nr:hypothetical protein SKAU_G00196340 [Synaphobranchus kaupii]
MQLCPILFFLSEKNGSAIGAVSSTQGDSTRSSQFALGAWEKRPRPVANQSGRLLGAILLSRRTFTSGRGATAPLAALLVHIKLVAMPLASQAGLAAGGRPEVLLEHWRKSVPRLPGLLRNRSGARCGHELLQSLSVFV